MQSILMVCSDDRVNAPTTAQVLADTRLDSQAAKVIQQLYRKAVGDKTGKNYHKYLLLLHMYEQICDKTEICGQLQVSDGSAALPSYQIC